MMADDYELISHREVQKLKEDLNKLKEGHPVSSDMKQSIRELNDKLGSLIEIFDSAVENLRVEDKETELISEKINPIIQKLEEIDDQNKKLAQGMVALNTLVDDKLSELNKMIGSLKQLQEDMEEKMHSVLSESKGSSSSSSLGSMGSSLPPLRSESDLFSSESRSSFPSDGSLGRLPPLPGSKQDKKKFKLF